VNKIIVFLTLPDIKVFISRNLKDLSVA